MTLHPVDRHIIRTLRAHPRLSTRALVQHTAHNAPYIRARLEALSAEGQVKAHEVPNRCGTVERQWEAL